MRKQVRQFFVVMIGGREMSARFWFVTGNVEQMKEAREKADTWQELVGGKVCQCMEP
jgi:hypothetical protein